MSHTSELRAFAYNGRKYANRDEADVMRAAQKATWLRKYRRQKARSSQNLLPFRVPCPTPLGCKVYLPTSGSIALSLLGQVLR